jgi:bifunctional non-homologous end joining protein LigD
LLLAHSMGLTEYKKKRSFKQTPEPVGGKSKETRLQFVIQKHDASRLHYDFRLELKGVLKSWAVPKGPSMNPAEKRLAMLVEDHPYDYKNFEGIIPPGNYGAGTVIIWDEGYYEPLEAAGTKEAQEKVLLRGFHAGQLKIRMYGQKLKGEFVLVKTPARADNAWLLIKHRDEHATTDNIIEKDRSVVSGKTIAEMTANKKAVRWKSNRTASENVTSASPPGKMKRTVKKKLNSVSPNAAIEKKQAPDKEKILRLLSKAARRNSPMPADLKPMLATLVGKPADKAGWLYEVKWDGYRAIAYLNDGRVDLRSRNNKDFNKKFYPIHASLSEWKINAVVDGEIVVVNEKGFPDFEALQNWRSEADGELVYYLFDVLWLEGANLMDMKLSLRKEILREIMPGATNIRLSENFDISASDLFDLAEKLGLEGIVAKKSDSRYSPDVRSKEWLKIKTEQHQEAVIAGYTRNENSSKLFSALLLGVYEGDELVFIGPVGTGFTTGMQKEILKKLKPLQTSRCPFREVPDYNKPSRFRPDPPPAEVTWVKPRLVAEIAYRTRTGDGAFRHPTFRGLRDDIEARDVVFEKGAAPVVEIEDEKILKSKGFRPGDAERKTLLNPKDETQVRTIASHDLKFTNLSKVFWPEEGFTKRDMLNYYYQVAPYMLPYYQDRPQTLNRYPNGIYGKSFYQKDVTGKVPEWIAKYKYYSETDQREKHFLVCSDEASLLYIASLGCIEMNPWSSRTQSPGNPDWCILDLDPDDNPFDQVIEAALVAKKVLDAVGVPSYCKTSGSTGLHIYIPLGAKYDYEDSKELGRAIVRVIHSQIPSFTSIERLTAKRKGKIYLDFLQNRPQATVAGPYSLRPRPGAPVSMPLSWEEVRKGLRMTDFNIRTAVARLKEQGDIFKGVLEEGIDRKETLRNIQKVFQVKDLVV